MEAGLSAVKIFGEHRTTPSGLNHVGTTTGGHATPGYSWRTTPWFRVIAGQGQIAKSPRTTPWFDLTAQASVTAAFKAKRTEHRTEIHH
jgi:alkylated DNA nucleotide flippase Atl1